MRSAPQAQDATALAASIAHGECSAQRVMADTLARIDRLNPALNAVCHVNAELGLRKAAEVDARVAACRDDAERAALLKSQPFLGVPLLLKDLGGGATDLPSTMGSRFAARVRGPLGRGLHWPVDSNLVARYRAAGFVLFGRSNVPEMGISPSTEAVSNGGPTRNPANPAHSAGGSSGGAAAAVASGMVAIAHANDGAGSIRIPASCCGLIGLKPSRGLMPAGPVVGESWGGLVSDHVLSTTVRDSAAALLATAGADPGAPYAAPGSLDGLLEQLERSREAPRLRIALCDTTFEGEAIDPEVAQAVRALASRLERLGHRVIVARPPIGTAELIRPLVRVVACGTALAVDRLIAQHGEPGPDELEPTTRSAIEIGHRTTAAEYLDCLSQVQSVARRLVPFFEQHDLLLTGVLAQPPARIGRWAMSNPDFMDYRLGPEGLWRYSPYAPLGNATGGASISVPAGVSANGLPVGAMLTGQLGDDLLLLRLAAELEALGTEHSVVEVGPESSSVRAINGRVAPP
jgi:amidase